MNRALLRSLTCALFILALCLAGCASAPSVSVIPLEDGGFRAVSMGQNEQQALNGSLQVAQSTCRDRQQRHVVNNVETRFRGAWSHPRDRREQAEQLADYVSSPTFPSLEANDDYEVKLQFKCV